jgi:hypothetical protein
MIGTGRRPVWPELRSQVMSTIGSLIVVVPPVVLLLLGVSGVIGLGTGFLAAKSAAVAVIGSYAFIANRRAGWSPGRSILGAAFLLALAGGLVMLKHYFH